jgi:hypothetical protein
MQVGVAHDTTRYWRKVQKRTVTTYALRNATDEVEGNAEQVRYGARLGRYLIGGGDDK